jgi:hypothetical protein
MLGTLLGLTVLIVGLVLRFDPEAKRRPDGEHGRAFATPEDERGG